MAYDNISDQIIKSTSPWHLESHLKDLSAADKALLKSHGRPVSYQAGDVVLLSGSLVRQLYYIDRGDLKLSLTNRYGLEKNIYFISRFYGVECYFHRFPALYQVTAVTDAEVYAIAPESIMTLLNQESIRDYLFHWLAMVTRILGWQINDLSLYNTTEKICRLLCCYVVDHDAAGSKRETNLTHQSLADMAGVHRVTVTNTLSQFKKKGWIKIKKDGTIVIVDWEQLKSIGFGNILPD